MSDPNQTPPPPNEPPASPPTFPAPPSGPAAAPQPPQPPAPGQWGAPPPPAPPGQFGAPPAPGQFGAPQPGQYGAPPSPGGFGGPPPPGGFQPAAQPYQYGAGATGQFELAAPGKRILGRIIDWLIIAAVLVPVYILTVAVGATSSSSSDEFGASDGLALGGFFVFMLLATVGQVLYEVGFIAIKGATPGKMLMKVRVVREADGQLPGWGSAFLRWLPNLVGMVPCAGSFLSLGLLIWALVNLFNNPKRQTPFDLAAKTVVIDASRG